MLFILGFFIEAQATQSTPPATAGVMICRVRFRIPPRSHNRKVQSARADAGQRLAAHLHFLHRRVCVGREVPSMGLPWLKGKCRNALPSAASLLKHLAVYVALALLTAGPLKLVSTESLTLWCSPGAKFWRSACGPPSSCLR